PRAVWLPDDLLPLLGPNRTARRDGQARPEDRRARHDGAARVARLRARAPRALAPARASRGPCAEDRRVLRWEEAVPGGSPCAHICGEVLRTRQQTRGGYRARSRAGYNSLKPTSCAGRGAA